MNECKVNSPPATIFIDKEGKIFARFNNTYNWHEPSMIDLHLIILRRFVLVVRMKRIKTYFKKFA